MAALTKQATVNADGSTTVVISTDDAIGSATAAFIFDNTITDKTTIMKAYEDLGAALRRQMGKVSSPTSYPTTGTSVE